MSRTTIADPALIPDIEAFEERVAIHIHEGGIPTDQAKDLAAQAQGCWIYGTFQTFAALAPMAGICAVRLRREAGVGVQAPFYVPISIGFLEKVGACIVLEVA